MIRRLWLGVWLAALLLQAGLTPVHAQESPYDLIASVNAYRAANGLGPFNINPSLMAAAQNHANWMAATSIHGHTGANGSTPQDRATAAGYQGRATENYTWGTSGYASIAWSVDWWSRSEIHNQNLLSDAPDIGAGIADNGTNIGYVLVFGRPNNAPTNTSGGGSSGSAGSASDEDDVDPIIPAVPVVQAESREDGAIVHVLQMGQTLWDVSVVYGVSLDELLLINNLQRDSVVFPGDEIFVRLPEGYVPPERTHTVQEGETLWDIAALNGLTLDQLLEYNGLERGAVIVPGDVLRLQPPPPTPTPTPTETPRPTDTPAPSPTPLPSATPLPTDTPPPATNTPRPTQTPLFTPTPSITPSPRATVTVQPSASATPAAVAQAIPTASPASTAPSTQEDSGTNPLLIGGIVLGILGLAMMAGGIGLVAGMFLRRR